MAKIPVRITAYFLIFFIAGCANQIAPGGGDVDRVPPQVESVKPADGTTNFSGHKFEIEFSEYVEKSSVRESIFISPNIEGTLEYDWGGKSVEISFEDTLKENTTYTVTIGTDVQDYNNKNNMAEPFSFVFSTGDEIDEFFITGTVYDKNPGGVIVFAYKNPDSSTTPLEVKPDYVSQVGLNGKYRFSGLGIGTYRLFAVRDDFKDYLYQPEDDQYGAPYTEVNLNDNDSLFIGLDFKLTREDTSKPAVTDVTMTDANHLYIKLSEHIDSSAVSADNFYIYDSTAGKRYPLDYLYYKKNKQRALFAAVSDSFNVENEIYVISDSIPDNYGNISGFEETTFVVNENPDTTAPSIENLDTEYQGGTIDFLNPVMRVYFDDAIVTVIPNNAVSIYSTADSVTVATEFTRLNAAAIEVKAAGKIEQGENYTLAVDMNGLTDAAGNSRDTVLTRNIKTVNDLDFSGVSGAITGTGNEPVVVVLNSAEQGGKDYRDVMSSGNNTYNINRVMPGKYILWAFVDTDSSGTYDYGNIEPFRQAEMFGYFPDTLNLRARWPVGEVNLKLGEFQVK